MTKYVVDANILISSVSSKQEPFFEQAKALYTFCHTHRFRMYVTQLCLIETANVLKEKKKFSEADIQTLFKQMFTGDVFVRYSEVVAVEKIVKTAYSYDLSMYDAEYVYLSESLKIPLITQDQKILTKYPNAKSLKAIL